MKKKGIKSFSMLFFAAMVSVIAVSCGDKGSSNDVTTPTIDNETTPAAQKAKLESVARELAGKVNADEFSNIKEMTKGVGDSETSILKQWFEGCLDACEVKKTDTSIYKMYALSNFKGSFQLNGNKWEKLNDNVDYLQFAFKDNSGKDCVLKLTHSGKETTVHHESFDREHYYSYYYNNYFHVETNKEIKSYVIPENANVTLTQDGKTVVSTDVHTSLNIGSGDVDITRDEANVTATTTINDYKFELKNALYSKSTSVEVPSFIMTKGSEELVSLTAKATGDISDLNDPVSKTAYIEVKVLGGKMRLVGNLTDGQTLQRNLENADKNNENETEYKKYIEKANALIDVKMYLDNSSKYGAYLQLKPFEKVYYSYYSQYKKWEYKPVLVFGDDSSYTFEEYFDENTFNNVINKVQNIIDDFVRMFKN